MLPDRQKELVREAREAFLKATRSTGAGKDETGRYKKLYNNYARVALVQGICEGIIDSDEEVESVAVLEKRAAPETETTQSGNA